MTWASLAASGSGKLVIWLRIAGIEYVFGTADPEPDTGDSWYWDPGPTRLFTGVVPWIQWRGISIDEQSSFLDGTLKIGDITVHIVDTDGGMTALMASWRSRNLTRLQANLDAGDLVAAVDSTANFPASGEIWVGQEAISYSGKIAAQLLGLTRGIYGTRDSDHHYDGTALPIPIEPAVLDGPQSICGRRANLYAATVEGGVVSASECIYRGIVGPDLEPGEGEWPVKIDHITTLWSRKIMSTNEETDVLQCYYYTGIPEGISSIDIREADLGAPSVDQQYPTVQQKRYDGYRDLCTEVQDKVAGACTAASWTRWCYVAYDDTAERIVWVVPAHAGVIKIILRVRPGDPMWALGFEPGIYDSGFDVAAGPGDEYVVEAQRDPMQCVLEVARPVDADAHASILVADSSRITAGLYARIADWPAVKVRSSTGGVVEIVTGRWDAIRHDHYYYCVEDKAKALIRHSFFLNIGTTIHGFLKRALHLLATAPEPEHWCVPLEPEDIDLTYGADDELATALEGAPDELTWMYDAISEPTAIDSIMCDRLGLLGITPRLTTDGRIGFTRISTPIDMVADSVEIDPDMWEHSTAAKVRTLVEGMPMLNKVTITHSYDYRTNKWPEEDSSVLFADGLNSRGKTFGKTYKCRGLMISDRPHYHCFETHSDLIHAVAVRAVGAHLGLYARVAPVVPIPCIWTSRRLIIGDVVRITHPCIVDIAEGAVGTEDRIGIVVGRRLAVTDNETDILYVQLPPEIHAGAIAPCALGTTWNQGIRRLTFASTVLYSNKDLGEFSAGMAVGFTEFNAAAPNTWIGTISAVGANFVDLTADVFGATFAVDAPDGVWMHWRSYDSCSTDQKAWLFLADTGYTIGAAGDDGYVWGL